MVHKHSPRRHAPERAVISQTDRAQIIIISHTGHYEISPRRRLARGFGRSPPIGLRPFQGFFVGAVVHRHVMTCLLQMPRHWCAHYAQTQKCQPCHVFPLKVLLRILARIPNSHIARVNSNADEGI